MQTEFGWPVIANCRGLGLLPVRPGSAGKPVPGWDCRVLSPSETKGNEFFTSMTEDQIHGQQGTHHAHLHEDETQARDSFVQTHHSRIHPAHFLKEADTNELGPLVIRLPLPPGALTTLYNNEARFRKGYTDPHDGYFEVCALWFEDECVCA